MLAYITGTVKAIMNQAITLDVGILGLSMQVPNPNGFQIEQKVTVHTYVHWNQEQGPSLFGFLTELDRTVFLLIISCSGLGPKIGLAVLNQLGPNKFLQAIQKGDDAALSKVNGIGAKKAEQIIVQLRHKVATLLKSDIDLGDDGSLEQWTNVADVLVSLNYSRPEVTKAMKHLGDTYSDSTLPFDQLMRHALSFLSKKP